MMEGKSLQPLTHGTVLIVGAKASNFDEEIKTNPRVIMWDSQNENWTSKDIPDNTRAVFLTRFVSHSASSKIIADARKRQITLFTPDGTGIIAKQVRELLNLSRPTPVITPNNQPVKEVKSYQEEKGKLIPLYEMADFSKSNAENARALMVKAKELGINTTFGSLAQGVGVLRRKQGRSAVPRSVRGKLDVSVEILENAMQSLKDVRDFLISTTKENTKLKEKVERFKRLLADE